MGGTKREDVLGVKVGINWVDARDLGSRADSEDGNDCLE